MAAILRTVETMGRKSNADHELILYLTPAGELGEQCHEFFRESGRRFGTTVAHTYPPHVTLTGFFRRSTARRATVVTELHPLLAAAEITSDAVSVDRLHVTEQWAGLEVTSPWAKMLTADVMQAHVVLGDEDALRPKDWLHLSLAYGLRPGQMLREYVAMAHDIIDPQAPVSWKAGLWERDRGGAWIELAP